MEREICEMKDNVTTVIVAVIIGVTVLSLAVICAKSAMQHGMKNRALIQSCIDADRRPVVGEYGRLESCE